MNNKISNPKIEVSKGMGLNDKDYLNCLLSTLKELTRNYALAMCEASNTSLYNIFKYSFEDITLLQREVFDLMFRKGWYQLEKSEVNKINDKFSTLMQEYQDLNS